MTDNGRSTSGEDLEALRRDREQVREELRETVDALAGKFDVRARATDTAQAAADTVRRRTTRVEQDMRERVEAARDHAGRVLDRAEAATPDPVLERGGEAARFLRRNPVPAVGAAAFAALVTWFVLRRRTA
ncbi:DUF3618 domain-containing protein [Nocardia sp. X0981]